MATEAASDHAAGNLDTAGRTRAAVSNSPLLQWLMPLASLRLTVALFAMAIFLVFAGTLAQVDQDIWDVMSQYFRTWFAWIDFQVFFPRSFFTGGAPQIP